MLELSIIVYLMMAYFGYIGTLRGFTKEVISLAGIMLGLFAMFQFDSTIRFELFASLPPDQLFYVQCVIFLVIVFFAYQQRAIVGIQAVRERAGGGRSRDRGRDPLQSRVLGGLIGLLNGYLVGGTLWYFLDINRIGGTGDYPLSPYITAPLANTANAQAVNNLPLYLLTQNDGNLLALAVVFLFILVLILI
ncbi:CvpA family protein [Phototrophicus methaneseepsis]|uniref:CvpA family protein n=1 Tax=Phototrophicus methaneseepsis TaxID=2710758 RepID=A0A7S8E7S4_9CHLR|nr:CvpA family protein [Phototrophicus methaneseepsis]QPC81926.1 CvpA family protein [Phototrophicus methaneseepsis]